MIACADTCLIFCPCSLVLISWRSIQGKWTWCTYWSKKDREKRWMMPKELSWSFFLNRLIAFVLETMIWTTLATGLSSQLPRICLNRIVHLLFLHPQYFHKMILLIQNCMSWFLSGFISSLPQLAWEKRLCCCPYNYIHICAQKIKKPKQITSPVIPTINFELA